MYSSKSIKNTSKAQLTQNWSKAYAAMAIILMASLCIYLSEQLVNSLLSDYGFIKSVVLPESAFSSLSAFSDAIIQHILSKGFLSAQLITTFFLLLRFLIISPLQLGHAKWYYSVVKGSKTYLSKLFFYYQSNSAYIYLLVFKFGQAIRRIGCGILSFIAPVAALSLSIYQFSLYSASGVDSDRNKAVLYLIVAALLFLLGFIMYLLLMLKYFLAKYLFVSINDFGGGFRKVNSCFSRSKEMMDGQSGKVISLAISFIPEILSCVLIFPVLYVYPFIRTSFAAQARSIIKNAMEADKD